MMTIGYFESLRWPLPGPKATHGILKGLGLLLLIGLVFLRKKLPKIMNPSQILIMLLWFLSYSLSTFFSQDIGLS